MAQRELTSALGRLLSDRRLRALHRNDAPAAARELDLRAADCAAWVYEVTWRIRLRLEWGESGHLSGILNL